MYTEIMEAEEGEDKGRTWRERGRETERETERDGERRRETKRDSQSNGTTQSNPMLFLARVADVAPEPTQQEHS